MGGILDDNNGQNTNEDTGQPYGNQADNGFSYAIPANAQVPLYPQQSAFGKNLNPYLAEAVMKDPSILPAPQQIGFSSVGNIHGIQLPVFNSPQGVLPLRAMLLNQMAPPPPSVNQKLMGAVIDKLLKHPVTDPALQKQVTNEWNKQLVDGALQEGINTYGNRTYEILSGSPRTEGELQYMLDTRKKIEYLNDAANLGKTLGQRLEKAKADHNADPEYMNALYDYQNTFRDNTTPFDEKVNKWERDVSRIQNFDSFDQAVKQYLPSDDILAKTWTKQVVSDVDKNGKPIQRELWTTTLNDGQTISLDVAQRAHQMSEDGKLRGEDWGIKNDAKREAWLAQRILWKLPSYQEMKEQAEPNITNVRVNVGDKTNTNPLPITPKDVTFGNGVLSQKSQYSTSFKPIDIALGNTTNAISASSSGSSEPITIGQNAKANGIVMLNVALNKSGSGVTILTKGDENKVSNPISVPYVQLEVPTQVHSGQQDASTGTSSGSSTDQYETIYVPLSEAQGDLINSSGKETQESIKKTIASFFETANELNDAHATKEAREYYKSNFAPSDVGSINY